ncbi:hypothetical protein V1511DRAFT_511477 [Dipodascopsis uninucleata]
MTSELRQPFLEKAVLVALRKASFKEHFMTDLDVVGRSLQIVKLITYESKPPATYICALCSDKQHYTYAMFSQYSVDELNRVHNCRIAEVLGGVIQIKSATLHLLPTSCIGADLKVDADLETETPLVLSDEILRPDFHKLRAVPVIYIKEFQFIGGIGTYMLGNPTQLRDLEQIKNKIGTLLMMKRKNMVNKLKLKATESKHLDSNTIAAPNTVSDLTEIGAYISIYDEGEDEIVNIPDFPMDDTTLFDREAEDIVVGTEEVEDVIMDGTVDQERELTPDEGNSLASKCLSTPQSDLSSFALDESPKKKKKYERLTPERNPGVRVRRVRRKDERVIAETPSPRYDNKHSNNKSSNVLGVKSPYDIIGLKSSPPLDDAGNQHTRTPRIQKLTNTFDNQKFSSDGASSEISYRGLQFTNEMPTPVNLESISVYNNWLFERARVLNFSSAGNVVPQIVLAKQDLERTSIRNLLNPVVDVARSSQTERRRTTSHPFLQVQATASTLNDFTSTRNISSKYKHRHHKRMLFPRLDESIKPPLRSIEQMIKLHREEFRWMSAENDHKS